MCPPDFLNGSAGRRRVVPASVPALGIGTKNVQDRHPCPRGYRDSVVPVFTLHPLLACPDRCKVGRLAANAAKLADRSGERIPETGFQQSEMEVRKAMEARKQ